MITSLHGSADFISIVVIVNRSDFNKGVFKGEERCVSSASAPEPPGKLSNAQMLGSKHSPSLYQKEPSESHLPFEELKHGDFQTYFRMSVGQTEALCASSDRADSNQSD